MESLNELLGIPDELTAPGAASLVSTQADDVVPAQATAAPVVEVVEAEIPKHEQELEEDMQAARKNLKSIATSAAQAAKAAILLAESGDSAKAFEAVAKMTEAIVTANKELIEIHRTRKETLKKANTKESLLPTTPQGPVNIEKAVFIGRASDLLRELRQMDKDQKALPANAESS